MSSAQLTGYGSDTWCTDTLVPGRYAYGAVLVGQALYRRLITPRGKLQGGDEESAYGFDVAGYIGAVGYPKALLALPGLVRGELMKDDRVSDIQVTATQVVAADKSVSITLVIKVQLTDGSQAFALTLSVDQEAAQIVSLAA
jgi:hypothetical protein